MSAIATIDDLFESYNVEMAEVIGGKLWKPYDSATLASLARESKQTPRASRDFIRNRIGPRGKARDMKLAQHLNPDVRRAEIPKSILHPVVIVGANNEHFI
jgi:hypothetical protein